MKHPRRIVAALACTLAVALGVLAPSVARAGEATPGTETINLFTISSCPECNGLPHNYGTGRTVDPKQLFEQAGKTWTELKSFESSDPSVVSVSQDERGLWVETYDLNKAGVAYVTLTSTNGEAVTFEVDSLNIYDHWDEFVAWYNEGDDAARQYLKQFHCPTLVVDDLIPYEKATIQTSWGQAYVGYTYTSTDTDRVLNIETSFSVSDPSVLTVDEDGVITPLKAGTTDVTMTITDLAHPEATFTDTATYTVIDDGEAPAEPWAADGSLLPYTIKDGVMTFDGRPDLGEWYQLDLDLAEGVTSGGNIGGAAMWTMTIGANSLDPSDPLYDANGWKDGPFWVRADNRGAYSGYSLTVPEGKALSTSLEGKGTLVPSGNGSILLVQLSGPSTLHASVADQTVITNEQGATLAHTPNDGDYGSDGMWSSLTLVTDWLGGDEAQTATNAVVAAVPGVTGHPYVYDIHLLDMFGDVFQIPDGDSVIVTLPIPEDLSADGLHVFHVADDGTVTDMGATVDAEAGTVSFTTTHFSTFVLANVTSDDGIAGSGSDTKQASSDKDVDKNKLAATGDAGSVAALLAAASGSAALLGARVLRKRR